MKDTSKNLSELRSLMQNIPNGIGAISAYIVPSGDAHQVCYGHHLNEHQNSICLHLRANTFVKLMNVAVSYPVSMDRKERQS